MPGTVLGTGHRHESNMVPVLKELTDYWGNRFNYSRLTEFAVKAGWVQDYSRVISSYVSSIRLCGPKDCNYVIQKHYQVLLQGLNEKMY